MPRSRFSRIICSSVYYLFSFKVNSICALCVTNQSFTPVRTIQKRVTFETYRYSLACSKPTSIFFKPLFRLSHSARDLVCKLSWLPQSLSSRTRLSASPIKFNKWSSKFFILVAVSIKRQRKSNVISFSSVCYFNTLPSVAP